MANEITITGTFSAIKGNVNLKQTLPNMQINWTNADHDNRSQTIATSSTAIGLSTEINAGGCAIFKNYDATNYVEIGIEVAATFYPILKLKPGEWNIVRLAIDTLYAKANTAAVKLGILVLNE